MKIKPPAERKFFLFIPATFYIVAWNYFFV